MPQRDHSTVWPADLQVQASELKAFVRARGLPSALHLLRGLLDRPDQYRHLWPSLAQTSAG